jgi:hypothetical protein
VQFGDCPGSTLVMNNVTGGISVLENSELSLWNCGAGYKHEIESNGPVGISVGSGGEATAGAEVLITGHKGPAVAVASNGVLYAAGSAVFSKNGAASVASGAGIAVSGNGHAYLQGATISSTPGPAILAQLGSTVQLSKMTFASNSGGVIQCDSTSFLWTDVTHANAKCTVPSTPQALALPTPIRSEPDTTAIRNRQAQYRRRTGASTEEFEQDQP